MSSPIYYHTDGSPYRAATIPLPPSPYSSPYSSPYGVHLIPLPPSPITYSVALPHSPSRNPLPLPPVTVPAPMQSVVTAASLAAGTDFTAHKLLAFSAEDPAIAWDVRLPLDTIRISKKPFRPLSTEQLNQPALSPPWTFVRLRSALLPWIVECTNPGGVTVGNVLDAIYDCLRTRVEKSEWRDATSDFQDRLLDAWHRRCLMTGDEEGRLARVREEKKGIRRVEWLLWDIEWLGIERSKSELETWDIHFRSR